MNSGEFKCELAKEVDQRTRFRFMGWVNQTKSCWFWEGRLTLTGYGQFGYDKQRYSAHRFSYLMHKGTIPPKYHVDHLCRNRSCVNPDHLEAVTCAENLLRSPWTLNSQAAARTHCINGHPFDSDNTYTSSRRKRNCRMCAKLRAREARKVA